MGYSPTVRGRRLMRELIRLRQSSGLLMETAASRLGWSKSKLYRLEAGRTRVMTDDLEDMLDLYEVRSPEREALLQLGRDARRRGWWTAYADVFTGSYIALEAEAASIRINANVVPGIFQTAEYAREMVTLTGLRLDSAEVERRVAARQVRQEALFGRPTPPEVHVALDEAALQRLVGGPAVMKKQAAGLAEAAARPNVTIQVLPFRAGGHAGIDGRFTIMSFPEPEDPPIAYVEGLMGDVYLESEDDVGLYELAWKRILPRALSPAESTAMIMRGPR